MRAILALFATALLLALAAPSAAADAGDVCYGRPVGWEGYQRTCVHPSDPGCLVEYSFYNLGEETHACYPGL